MGVPTRRAGADDREAVTRLLHEGFFHDPVSCWVFPEETHRRSTHGVLMGAFLDMALDGGYVDMAEDASAAAVWLSIPEGDHTGPSGDSDPPQPPGSSAPPAPDDAAMFRQAVDPPNERIEQIARLTAAVHPTHPAHDYLMLIAVSPALHGKGLGTTLLSAALGRLDRESRPAYLEATTLRSRSLYERHGFTSLGDPVALPAGPLMYPMWREPHEG
jgi:GNAT superfamily N-acetyltransferase